MSRAVDPTYPTNRAVIFMVLLLFVIGAGWSVMNGTNWSSAALAGLNLSVVAFLSWAWSREVTPDQERLAFLAMAIAVVIWSVAGSQQILGPALGLIAVRMVNRSTGKAAEHLDTVNMTLAFGLVAWFLDGTFAAVGGVALIGDALLPHNEGQASRRYHVVPGVLLVVMGFFRFPFAATVPTQILDWVGVILVGSAALLALTLPKPRAIGDVDGMTLLPLRARAGALIGIGMVALTLVNGSDPWSFGVGWASVITFVIGAPLRFTPRAAG